MKPATPRQLELLELIAAFVAANGYPPSYREMAAAMGVTSTNTIACVVDALEARGLLWCARGQSRAMRITELGKAVLATRADEPRCSTPRCGLRPS